MRNPLIALLSTLFVLALSNATIAQDGAAENGQESTAETEELTLEYLLPEESPFGPSASGMAFSPNGRYAAYLYRPYIERRHGSDLWLYDTQSGESTRITSVAVMSPFQRNAREVRDDRITRHEPDSEGDEDPPDHEELADSVGEGDAEDASAPRYGGVSGFVWALHDHELIFTSGTDLYRYIVASGEITRLTRSRSAKTGVQYLPDGSGYTYLQNGSLMKVSFDGGMVQQLDPQLPGGETMTQYTVSPDGSRIVFLAQRGNPDWISQGSGVTIVHYRNRLAEAERFDRHMPGDPIPDLTTSIYLYDIDDHAAERDTLKRVFTHKHTGLSEAVSHPDWAPDSSRVTFAAYVQNTRQVTVHESRIDENGANHDEDQAQETGDTDAARDDSEPDIEIQDARAVYRFVHNGGPMFVGSNYTGGNDGVRPQYLADGERIAFITELSGFKQLHVLDPVYESLNQITRGRFEIYPFGLSPDRSRMFAIANKGDVSQRHVFSIDLESGAMTQLSTKQGVHSEAAVSPDGVYVLTNHVDFGSPVELYAINATDNTSTQITDSHPQQAHDLTAFEPEYFTYENRHGHSIRGHMYKPDDWSPDDKRPMLIYVYGGPIPNGFPIAQQFSQRGSFWTDSYYYSYYMAKKHGYVTCTIDPRGGSGYGAVFERSNFENVGRAQVEDLVDGVSWFVENQGVDKDRVALHGWSFGGFQTQMCLYTAPDVFAAGMAGVGPTEWKNYNSWYTTATIGKGDDLANNGDDELFSLLPLAKNLKAKLLLVHGMQDANVLFQDTVHVYRELLKAGKESLVELFLDTTGGHSLGGDVSQVQKYRKYESFLLQHLGDGSDVPAGG